MQQELTAKQQTSEAIRQAETILIITGQRPTVDQLTAVLSLASVLRKFGKRVSAVVSDPVPANLGFLDTGMLSQSLSGLRDFVMKLDLSKAEVDKLRYEVENGKLNVYVTPFQGGFSASDVTFAHGDYHFDLAIVLGVASRSRIDRIYVENQSLFSSIPVINLDYHRTNDNFGAINLIDPMASSLCEILVALSESLQTGLIDADIATIMLTGLIGSTDRFTASHTTSKSMTVAAQLMAAGARQQAIVKGLYGAPVPTPARPERSERAPRPDARPDRPAQQPRADQPRPQSPQSPSSQARSEQAPADQSRSNQPRPVETAFPRANQTQPSNRYEPARTDQTRKDQPVRVEPASSFPEPEAAIVPTDPQRDAKTEERPVLASRQGPSSEPTWQPLSSLKAMASRTDEATMDHPEPFQTVDAYEPIIAPGHIQMSPPEEATAMDVNPADIPVMADFAAAALVLRRDQSGTVDAPAKSADRSPAGSETSPAQVNPARDRV